MCTGRAAIKPSRADVLTPGTERQILTNNLYGEALGCPGFDTKK